MDEPLLDEDEHNLNTNEGPWWLTGDEPPTTTTSVSRRINHWSDDDNNNPPFKAQQDREAEEIPDAVLYSMRIMNMVVAVALIISTVYTPPLSISLLVLSSYLTTAGLLICCIELDLSFLRSTLSLNFGFTHSPTLRFVFYILLSVIPWGYHTLVGKIVSVGVAVVGVLNVYILCKYPGYRRERERIAREEEERMEELFKRELRGRMVRRMVEAEVLL
mmetsp:Transcript_3185/g.3831  ORF Transcript_3185/g.3831 Transcript_3185/m.3831 type:complete len:218 (-) Transcript_3185:938-1591(-)